MPHALTSFHINSLHGNRSHANDRAPQQLRGRAHFLFRATVQTKKQMKTQLYIIHGAGKRTLHLQVLEIRRAGRADNTIVSSEHKIVSASLAFPDLPSSLRRAGDPSVLFTRHATHG
jgi:hypothetical protein